MDGHNEFRRAFGRRQAPRTELRMAAVPVSLLMVCVACSTGGERAASASPGAGQPHTDTPNGVPYRLPGVAAKSKLDDSANRVATTPGQMGYGIGAPTSLRDGPSRTAAVSIHLPFGSRIVVRETAGDWLTVCLAENETVCGHLHSTEVAQTLDGYRSPPLIEEFWQTLQSFPSPVDARVDGREFGLANFGPEEGYLQSVQSGLEHVLHFKRHEAQLKHWMRALYVMNARMTSGDPTYASTPLEVLRRSRQYGSLPVSAYASEETAGHRCVLDLPRVSESFFDSLEPLVLVKATGEGTSISHFQYVPHALFSHLLRTFFADSNDLRLMKHRQATAHLFHYESNQVVPFFSMARDGRLERHTGRMMLGRALLDDSPSLEGEVTLLFVGGVLEQRLESLEGDVQGEGSGCKRSCGLCGGDPRFVSSSDAHSMPMGNRETVRAVRCRIGTEEGCREGVGKRGQKTPDVQEAAHYACRAASSARLPG